MRKIRKYDYQCIKNTHLTIAQYVETYGRILSNYIT